MTGITLAEWNWAFSGSLFKSTLKPRKPLPGVRRDHDRNTYVACGFVNKQSTVLYYGPDYFEACCARLSWLNRNPKKWKILSEQEKIEILKTSGSCKAVGKLFGVSAMRVSELRRGL
jgi:hypothetical protein